MAGGGVPFDDDLYKLYSPRVKGEEKDNQKGGETSVHESKHDGPAEGSEHSDRASTCEDSPTETAPDAAPVEFRIKHEDHSRWTTEYAPYYTNDGVRISPPAQPPIPPADNISDRDATSGNSAAEDLKPNDPGVKDPHPIASEKDEEKATTPRPGTAKVITSDRSEPSERREELTLVSPKAISPKGTPPRMNSPTTKTSIPDLEKNLHELQACIGKPPLAYTEVPRRQMLARDLRLDPSLYNWMVVGISPGTSPRDVRAPLGSRELEEETDPGEG